MKSYLYSSPTTYDDGQGFSAGAPRRQPTINFNSRSTPQGQYTNTNYSGIPFSPPTPLPMNTASVNLGYDQPVSMPLEQATRMRNQGNIARGPSPQFAASKQGLSRFGSYGEQGQALNTPAQSAGPPQQQRAAQPIFNKTRHDLLTKNRDDALKALKGLPKDENKQPIKDDAYHAAFAEYQKHNAALNEYRESILGPAQQGGEQPAAPAQAAPATQPAQQPAKANPPTPTLPMSGPAYDSRVRQMYGTAGADLAEHPLLGVKPLPETPIPPLSPPPSGMGNSPADYRQASGRAYSNQSAIARMNDAPRQQQMAQNQGQMQQNSQGLANIEAKGPQFDAQRAATTQPSQPGQQQAGQKPSRAMAEQYVQKFGDPQRAAEELKKAGFDVTGYAD